MKLEEDQVKENLEKKRKRLDPADVGLPPMAGQPSYACVEDWNFYFN